jgi:undecaprenyl pyrophosphate synthase
VYGDAAEAAARPHASVSHEAAISAWRAAEAAVAGLQDVHVEVVGAYEWKRYSYQAKEHEVSALAALQNQKSCSDITSCPVDTVTMNIRDALHRLWSTYAKIFGSRGNMMRFIC